MRKLYIIISILIFWSCGSKNKNDEQAFLDSLNNLENKDPKISEEVMKELFERIPSPLEMSVLIKEVGGDYDKSLLNQVENSSKYSTSSKKALNLGIYGTDLGYCNIYEQNQDALFYLNDVKKLADGLSIGQFFEFSTIKRLATNSNNLDSLLLITTKNFNKVNNYLQKNQRSNLSILILAGGWLEALHLTCQVVKKNPQNATALRERIGEQKEVLKSIIKLLSYYKTNSVEIATLIKELNQLKKVYEKVEIKKTEGETTYEVVDGIVMAVSNDKSEVIMTDQELEKIIAVTASIRNQIIS